MTEARHAFSWATRDRTSIVYGTLQVARLSERRTQLTLPLITANIPAPPCAEMLLPAHQLQRLNQIPVDQPSAADRALHYSQLIQGTSTHLKPLLRLRGRVMPNRSTM